MSFEGGELNLWFFEKQDGKQLILVLLFLLLFLIPFKLALFGLLKLLKLTYFRQIITTMRDVKKLSEISTFIIELYFNESLN